jgi:ubiquinone/menaquinone biosynthesis C-methylase UbiE
MVEQARQLNPGMNFIVADMARLNLAANALAGILAFYSIIHIPKPQVATVLEEFKRALAPGGWLLLSFHRGGETRHFDELWGVSVNLDFIFFEKAEMEDFVRQAGFEIAESLARAPYPDVEVATHRVYLLARKPL